MLTLPLDVPLAEKKDRTTYGAGITNGIKTVVVDPVEPLVIEVEPTWLSALARVKYLENELTTIGVGANSAG